MLRWVGHFCVDTVYSDYVLYWAPLVNINAQ